MEGHGFLAGVDTCNGVDNGGGGEEGEDKEQGEVSEFEEIESGPFRGDEMGEPVVFGSSSLGCLQVNLVMDDLSKEDVWDLYMIQEDEA